MSELVAFPKAKHWYSAGPQRVRDICAMAYQFAKELSLGHAVEIIVRPVKSRRTLEQNAKLWAMLGDIARQVPWHVNGVMQRLEAEDWKNIMTATVRQEVRMAAGINGGFVLLGVSTRKLAVAEMGELIEFMYSFGAEHGVVWKEPKGRTPEHWEQAA